MMVYYTTDLKVGRAEVLPQVFLVCGNGKPLNLNCDMQRNSLVKKVTKLFLIIIIIIINIIKALFYLTCTAVTAVLRHSELWGLNQKIYTEQMPHTCTEITC